ncbi:hypothetical protein G3M74_10110 [Paenibacillus polymyxa]|nr:hypothetical protein [Paenibacillus polymyxa]NEU26466.1 hypothetical protein [Paenibacillus polymyxa]
MNYNFKEMNGELFLFLNKLIMEYLSNESGLTTVNTVKRFARIRNSSIKLQPSG